MAPQLRTIKCETCQEEVPAASGGQRYCPPCAEKATKAWKRASYLRSADRQRAQRRARYVVNREAELSDRRLRNYGATDDELLALLDAQHGVCPICIEPLTWPRVAVDHCHSTGKIRGLLHNLCNTGLGHFRDVPEHCDRAAAYLRANA